MSFGDEPSYHIGHAYTEMVRVGGKQAHGKLIDLSMWTDPPQPYHIYKAREVVARNPLAPKEMQGTKTVGGLSAELWDGIRPEMLPSALRMGHPTGYFYQVHHSSVEDLAQLERHLEDPTGKTLAPSNNPRRRVVILLEYPLALSDTRRFARKRASDAASVAIDASPAVAEGKVTVLDEQVDIPAVYEWWFGPAQPQQQVERPPIGRWRSYHPQVCRHLEGLFQSSPEFKSGDRPVDVDGVRYMMQHISAEKPFNYIGQPSRETFLQANVISVEHPCFSDMDRETSNCFVQFQRGNPQRRRPARRKPDASEIARSAVMTGSPCSICCSEDGQLTGCNRAHVVCKTCLRAGLRSMAGDTLVVENLLCGCFGRHTRRALLVLAEHADVSLQDAIAKPPTDPDYQQDFAKEMHDTRRLFDLGEVEKVPTDLYVEKVRDWFKKVFMSEVSPLYHVCSHPDCAKKMEHWMLKEEFERQYQANGKSSWRCPAGHTNSVLPSDEEVRSMNSNLLRHPEYYVESAYYDLCALRRYRLCTTCLEGGCLMLAVHGGECKQWPGSGRGHQHVFCFACSRSWGRTGDRGWHNAGCDHGSTDCKDPGVQQVRRVGDSLEVGFVDGKEYLKWLRGEIHQAPPTVFPKSGQSAPGSQRQEDLGLTNRSELLAESRHGTT